MYFILFEPLHKIRDIQAKDYDEYVMNYLRQIFQCDFSVGLCHILLYQQAMIGQRDTYRKTSV